VAFKMCQNAFEAGVLPLTQPGEGFTTLLRHPQLVGNTSPIPHLLGVSACHPYGVG